MFIINAPALFARTFQVIASWLDEPTRAKVQLFGSTGWQEPVGATLDPRILPVGLGGERELAEAREALEPRACG